MKHVQIEMIRPLRIRNILENVAQLKPVMQLVALNGRPRSDIYKGEGQIPMEIVHEAAKKLPYGDCSWAYFGTTYG